MIKFFRHIRQNLLQNGRTKKYFQYALGEIALVVIGILLALQINNWNEQLKIKNQERAYITSIKQDLLADVKYLESFISDLETEYDNWKIVKERVSKNSFNKDSIINYVRNEIYPFTKAFQGFNNNSFESLKTSGKIELINEPVKKNYTSSL